MGQPFIVVLFFFITAISSGSATLLIGSAARSEDQVLSQFQSGRLRIAVLSDADGVAHISPEVVGRLTEGQVAEWAFSLGSPFSVNTTAGGVKGGGLAARAILAAEGVDPRLSNLGPQQALIARSKAILSSNGVLLGAVQDSDGRQWQLVGTFDPELLGGADAIGDVFVGSAQPSTPRRVVARIGENRDPSSFIQVMLDYAQLDVRPSAEVTTSGALVRLQSAIRGELGASNRVNAVRMLAATGFVLLALSGIGVRLGAEGFGLMRCMGGSRLHLMTGVLGLFLLNATLGAGLGVAVAYLRFKSIGYPLDANIVMNVVLMTAQVAVLGALVPALLASFRDPVRVLRSP